VLPLSNLAIKHSQLDLDARAAVQVAMKSLCASAGYLNLNLGGAAGLAALLGGAEESALVCGPDAPVVVVAALGFGEGAWFVGGGWCALVLGAEACAPVLVPVVAAFELTTVDVLAVFVVPQPLATTSVSDRQAVARSEFSIGAAY
jgi:hypothetical protein